MGEGHSAVQMEERNCRWRELGRRGTRRGGAPERRGREGMGLRERAEGETVLRHPLEFEVERIVKRCLEGVNRPLTKKSSSF